MIEKVTELGVEQITPIVTDRTNNKNFNDTQRVKLPNKYEDFLIDNNNIFFKTKNSIIKF